ncbi:MAG: 2OG-Fe(II) oxygenase, partial [Pseudomonadota bacterium]
SGWSGANGGNLELWDSKVATRKEIVSAFNRLVVMETNNSSWHSVNPVTADAPRRCISNYYFSPDSPNGKTYYHVTSFLGRPEQPLRRLVGRFDSAARQTIASVSGVSRGKHLARDEQHKTVSGKNVDQ